MLMELGDLEFEIGYIHLTISPTFKRTRLDPGSAGGRVDEGTKSEKTFRLGAGSSWRAATCSASVSWVAACVVGYSVAVSFWLSVSLEKR